MSILQHLAKKPANFIPLPPAGPAWFGAVMGTGILSNLLRLHAQSLPWAGAVSTFLLALAWLIMIVQIVGYFFVCLKRPGWFKESILKPANTTAWGMVSMGILSVGSATSTSLPVLFPSLTDFAWHLHGILWVIGLLIGVASSLGFSCVLISAADCGAPTPAWALPIVAPMVASTVGSAFAPHLGSITLQFIIEVIAAGCFFNSLCIALAIFIVAYQHAWFKTPLPLAASVASWIPLGIVGQSTAAAQNMANQSGHFLLREELHDTIHQFANVYSYVILLIGIPLFLWALKITFEAFKKGIPFTPGWWAMTFPIGTCCLGTYFLGVNVSPFYMGVSIVLTLMLCVTWLIATLGSLRAIIQTRCS